MTSPVEWLSAVEGRAAKATEGPWRVDRFWWKLGSRYFADRFWLAIETDEGELAVTQESDCNERADFEFIAAARTDVPEMAAALRAVLALHSRGIEVPSMCPSCLESWPCETDKAITKPLVSQPNHPESR